MATELTPKNLLEAAAGGDVGEVMKLLDVSSIDSTELRENLAARLNIRDRLGRTAFHLAVGYNKIVAIQTLVRTGADINLSDNMQCTPLHKAVEKNIALCVDELIKLGADIHCVDAMGRNALMLAAEYGNVNCLHLLIEIGADIHRVGNEGLNALMYAIKDGNVTCVQLLIEAGADLNLQVKHDGLDYLGETALMFAVQHRRVDTRSIRLLLEAGADVNVKTSGGKTALHCAGIPVRSYNDSVTCDCIRILIEFGSDVTTTDSKGETALMYAARTRNMISPLSILVDAGAVVDQQDSSGRTALAHAVSTGIHECVRWLVDHGASVNECDYSGKTPLHFLTFAIDNDTDATKCLEALLSKHPDVNAMDKDGMTPLMCMARKHCRIFSWATATMAMLLEHGAEINLVDHQGQTALIHSLGLDSDKKNSPRPINLILTGCFKFLLRAGANPSLGQIASGQLSRLAYLDCDLDLIKLQVGSTVDLEAPWQHFVSLFNDRKRRILQFLIISGVVPLKPSLHDIPQSRGELPTISLLESAGMGHNLGVVKYLIALCYLRAEDFTSLCSGRVGEHFVSSMMNNHCNQPWPLVKLCFVAVSTVFGASPGRQERVKNSQLPVKLQKMLLFQEPWSRLCVHQWDKIPLTFSPEEYEKRPRPRPLFYHWPVGRALVPCDCGKCDGTMYKYDINKEEEKIIVEDDDDDDYNDDDDDDDED